MLKQVQPDGSITAKIGLNTYNRNDVGHNCRSFTYEYAKVGFALGIVRVQCRSFIGTGAKRSPKNEPDPCVAWVTPKSVCSWQFTVFVGRDL